MNQAVDAFLASTDQQDLNKRALQYGLRLLSLYRLLLGTLLLSLYYAKFNIVIGNVYPNIFVIASLEFLLLGLLSLLFVKYISTQHAFIIPVLLCLDIVFAIIIIHSSGGIGSDLSIILLVTIASAGLLVSGRFCFLAAVASSFGILTQEYFGSINQNFAPDYVQSITLALAIFATAGLSIVINKRASESEKLAIQRSIDIENLTQLNEYIIFQMKNGALVIDQQKKIILHNQAAKKMLGEDSTLIGQTLQQVSEQLHIRLLIWQEDQNKPARIKEPGSPLELQPFFISIGQHKQSGTLIFIEDSSAYTEEFQSLKQASLGRLAGSIAHEIRNPLSAIQHAAQLMDEDEQLSSENKRMLEIINKQSNRVNRIIENVMQLSKKEHFIPENIDLNPWFVILIEEFVDQIGIPAQHIKLSIQGSANVLIDSSQLYQIMWNILSNSNKYGTDADGNTIIHIDGYKLSQTYVVEMCDNGSGIPKHVEEHIFEPFYSGNSNSSGLGLYIVRELCELNNIDISYHCDQSGIRKKPYFKLAFKQLDKNNHE